MTSDIVKRTVLRAPLTRVWNAITDPAAFGAWFGAEWDGPFIPGHPTTGRIVPTTVDAAIAESQEPFAGMPLTLHIDAIEPMRLFAFRWNASPESDALTTVTFALAEVTGGVELTITESGFDSLPVTLRDTAREQNDGGWAAQAQLIAQYLELP